MSLHVWHSVILSRTGRHGSMQVDGQPVVSGQSHGSFTQMTLTLGLFVGGHRNFDEIAAMVDVEKSFRGCIQNVSVVASV